MSVFSLSLLSHMTLEQNEVGGKVFILNNYDTDAFFT
jgi:hypothetical protein